MERQCKLDFSNNFDRWFMVSKCWQTEVMVFLRWPPVWSSLFQGTWVSHNGAAWFCWTLMKVSLQHGPKNCELRHTDTWSRHLLTMAILLRQKLKNQKTATLLRRNSSSESGLITHQAWWKQTNIIWQSVGLLQQRGWLIEIKGDEA